MDGWGKKEKGMFALSHVGFCWASGRAPRAYARLQRQYESTAAERRRKEVLARLEASGRSDRICVIQPRKEHGVEADRASWDDAVQEQFLPSHHPIPPTRTVFY